VSGGGIICLTGLPQSGKSTLGRAAVRRLRREGLPALLLDGDAVREALVPPPGYSEKERETFYATLANLAGLLARQGLWVAVAATHHLRRFREGLRARAPGQRYLVVLVDATQEQCEARDAKGLYARFRRGLAPTLPGKGVPYQRPARPDVVASGGRDARAAGEIARKALSLSSRGGASSSRMRPGPRGRAAGATATRWRPATSPASRRAAARAAPPAAPSCAGG